MSNGSMLPPDFSGLPRLYVRVGSEIREAPPDDQDLARSYPGWPDKGVISDGRRLTILTARQRVGLNEEVRVIHVAEAIDPGVVLYTMGPKAISGESVDGILTTAPRMKDDDPLRPAGLYDGPVVAGPAIDYGYDVTTYTFDATGLHRIVWQLGELVSNELLIWVE
ncbi:hypothetical protein [Dyella tabacisoli]|uniref:Uncharacterized protein n=1 Tax=Dyella tabacisoli TaxID=2282381 RepID=A0A369UMH3_9GAMM|nr:hypothetical protein [Dyella tabacisoli]RDD81543.1 hypothetical protein DVJ77_10210 [Dyella tabacisoli]